MSSSFTPWAPVECCTYPSWRVRLEVVSFVSTSACWKDRNERQNRLWNADQLSFNAFKAHPDSFHLQSFVKALQQFASTRITAVGQEMLSLDLGNCPVPIHSTWAASWGLHRTSSLPCFWHIALIHSLEPLIDVQAMRPIRLRLAWIFLGSFQPPFRVLESTNKKKKMAVKSGLCKPSSELSHRLYSSQGNGLYHGVP